MKIAAGYLLASLMVVQPLAGFAQNNGTEAERRACEPDVHRLCEDMGLDRDRIIGCLNRKVKQLSQACRTVILYYVQERQCAPEAARYCGELVGDREGTVACLLKRPRTLHSSCRQALVNYNRERR